MANMKKLLGENNLVLLSIWGIKKVNVACIYNFLSHHNFETQATLKNGSYGKVCGIEPMKITAVHQFFIAMVRSCTRTGYRSSSYIGYRSK